MCENRYFDILVKLVTNPSTLSWLGTHQMTHIFKLAQKKICKCRYKLCSGDVEAVDCFHIALLDSLPGEMLMSAMAQVNKINKVYFPQTDIHPLQFFL